MAELLSEKVLTDHDHDETDGDDVAHDHLDNQQGLLESREL